MQKHVNLVDLVKSFPTNIFLQNLASIQKRTSPLKFAHLAEKLGKGSISNLSTKAETTNLNNELEELEKLKPVCVESGATHAERTARREQEIEALKEALKILEETDFGF